MNIEKAKQIPIEEVLKKMNFKPSKTNGFDVWFISPFRDEKTPSFKVNTKINRWFDYGEQKGGNVLDLLILIFAFSISEALKYLEVYSEIPSFSFQKQKNNIKESTISIVAIKPIQHLALLKYLETRKILNLFSRNQIKEIHYCINEKKYFGIGFKNNSSGWEILSKYSKICLLKKNISLIENNSNCIRIFEGFLDFLSFIEIYGIEKVNNSDNLILNSVALLEKNISILNNYLEIEIWLDNDEAGNKFSNLILNQFPNANDFRKKYLGFKDLNEFLCEKYFIKE